jgi:hypothetical protein
MILVPPDDTANNPLRKALPFGNRFESNGLKFVATKTLQTLVYVFKNSTTARAKQKSFYFLKSGSIRRIFRASTTVHNLRVWMAPGV